jgi:hypothetical protein
MKPIRDYTSLTRNLIRLIPILGGLALTAYDTAIYYDLSSHKWRFWK